MISILVSLYLSTNILSQYAEPASFNVAIIPSGENRSYTQNSDVPTLFDARKNSVCLDFLIIIPAVGYSRIIPFKENGGLVISASVTPFYGFIIDLGGGFIFGKYRHFFEPAAGYWFTADNFYAKIGYRFQGDKGLVLKIAPVWSFSENSPFFTAGVGYAFN